MDTVIVNQSIKRIDSLAVNVGKDSKGPITPVEIRKNGFSGKYPIDSIYLNLLNNPFFNNRLKPVYHVINEKKRNSKDDLFYILLALMFFLSLIKLSFSKYFNSIFRLFIQPVFRMKQSHEQISQNDFPSLMLNLFFIVSSGVFVGLIVNYFGLSQVNFATDFLYATIFLFLLYSGKFVILSFAGWVFDSKDITDTYIHVVFLVNKVMGIALLPFSFIMAFSKPEVITIGVTISMLIILFSFGYRYIVSIVPIRREMKISIFHFFFYIMAFEITPLLLLYKTLGYYLTKST